ncbi:MAG: response regulator transcription factor [Candidatus Melainabacteria bacterium]|nr:response regulator transcription factor [Candidatus Melainabacteria bacterium]
MAKILIVEDDKILCANLNEWLRMKNYTVEMVHSGDEAMEYLRSFEYDAIILDWSLPVLSGIEICRQYRAGGGSAPVLILTGKDTIQNKEEGFEAGADDYLTKPFHAQELVARVHALMRRPAAYKGATISIGGIVLDTTIRRVTRDGKEIHLQPTEFMLLEFFMRHPNRVFSSDEILDKVWSNEKDTANDTVRVHINKLRKKIDREGLPVLIRTIHGSGYILDQ